MRKKPSGVRSSSEELFVRGVDLAREERCAQCVRAGDENRRHVRDVGGEPRGHQRPDELARRDEHLAAQVAALLFRGELILVMDACSASFDHGTHQLVRLKRAAEAGLGIRNDR